LFLQHSARALLHVDETSVSGAGVNVKAHGLDAILGLRQFHIFLQSFDTVYFVPFFKVQNSVQEVNEFRLLFKNLFENRVICRIKKTSASAE
jgi:hypothetical protein